NVLPIFATSTRLSRCTGSPVNGDSSGPRGDGDGEGAGLGAVASLPAGPRVARITPVTVSATAAAAPAAVSAMRRRSQTICATPQGDCPPRSAFHDRGD